MRTNLYPLLVAAAFGTLVLAACADERTEPPAAGIAESKTGDGPAADPAPGTEANPAGAPGSERAGDPAADSTASEPAEVPDGQPQRRRSVVVIPPEELEMPSEPAAPGDATGPAGTAPAPEAASPSPGASTAAGSPAPAEPAGASPAPPGGPGGASTEGPTLPATPRLEPPAEALPATVVAVGPLPEGVAPGTGDTGGEAGSGAPEAAGPDASGGMPEAAAPPAPAAPRVTLDPNDDTAVPPGSVLEIASPVALVDARFRLFDEGNRVVPSRDRVTVGDGTQVRIAPEAPLPPGSSFRLEITGQLEQYPTGADGKHFAARTFRFHTTGEKPEPPPPPKRGRRR